LIINGLNDLKFESNNDSQLKLNDVILNAATKVGQKSK